MVDDAWGCLCQAQDTERGRQASMTTLLAEVSERAGPKPSREEAERLKQEVRGCPAGMRLSPHFLISISNMSTS